MRFCSEIPSRPKRFGRAYTLNETDTTHSTTSQVSTDQSLTVSQTVYSSNVDTTTDETGNNITGSYTSPSSSSSTVTTLETDVNQTLTSSITQYATESGSQTDSGNEITGADSWTAGTSTTHTTRYETDSNQGLVAVSTAIDVDTDTNSGSTNDITGSYSLYETDSDPTTIYETDTQSPSYTTISTTETQNLSTTTNIGNDTTGDQTVVTSGILSSVETEHNTNGLMASTQSATTSDTSQDTNVGNTLDGSYTDTSSDSSRVTTTEWDIDTGSSDYDVETDTASTPTQVEIGNSITGGYSLAGTLTTTSTDNELDSDGGQTVSTYDNSAGTTYTLETDNSITGNSTTTTSFTNTDSLDETTLADGGDYSYINDQDSTDADYDLPGGEGGVPTVQVGNDITGAYTILAGTDTSVMTVYESDTEVIDDDGDSPTLYETNTGTNFITDTTTQHPGSGGNDITGTYSLLDYGSTSSITYESDSGGDEGDYDDTTSSETDAVTTNSSGNNVLQQSTVTNVEVTTSANVTRSAGSDGDDQDSEQVTDSGSTTAIETQNAISGAYGSTIYNSSSEHETDNSGTTDLTDNSTAYQSGNQYSGSYTSTVTDTSTSKFYDSSGDPNPYPSVDIGGAWVAISIHDTDTSTAYQSGNEYTGGYSLTTYTTDTTTATEVTVYSSSEPYVPGLCSLSAATTDDVTSTNTTSETIAESGNALTGRYTGTGTGQDTSVLEAADTVGWSITYTGAPYYGLGSQIPKGSGNDYYAVSTSGNDAYSIAESGNSLTGDYTVAHTDTQPYKYTDNAGGTDTSTLIGGNGSWNGVVDWDQTDTYRDSYHLAESGTESHASTDIGNQNTGDQTLASSGTDRYTIGLGDTVSEVDQGVNPGTASSTRTGTLSGTDAFTQNDDDNVIAGAYTPLYSVTGTDRLSVTGTDTLSGSTNPYDSEGPVNVDASDTRYDIVLGVFGNISNTTDHNTGANPALGTIGGTDIQQSPVGIPASFEPGQGPVGGTSEAIGPGGPGPAEMSAGAQSGQAVSGAAADAVYSQLGANALYEYCFARETPIALADGTEIPIMTAVKGGRVRAKLDADPMGPTVDAEIAEVYENAPAHLSRVGFRGRAVRATDNHPWYVINRGWIPTKDLHVGDLLLGLDGAHIPIDSIEDRGEIEPVYNLQVRGAHTYFAGGVLVHNQSGGGLAEAVETAEPLSPTETAPGGGQAGTGAGGGSGPAPVMIPGVGADVFPNGARIPIGFTSKEDYNKAANELMRQWKANGQGLDANGNTRIPTVGEVQSWRKLTTLQRTNAAYDLDSAVAGARAAGVPDSEIQVILGRRYVSAPGGPDGHIQDLNMAARNAIAKSLAGQTPGPGSEPGAPGAAGGTAPANPPPAAGGGQGGGGLVPPVATGGEDPNNKRFPQYVIDTLATIRQTDAAPAGYRGGRGFENDGRNNGEILPRMDSEQNPITYREWDVHPYQRGANRGEERIVTGSDGSAYYTNNHYSTFTRIE